MFLKKKQVDIQHKWYIHTCTQTPIRLTDNVTNNMLLEERENKGVEVEREQITCHGSGEEKGAANQAAEAMGRERMACVPNWHPTPCIVHYY
jgi:hypothetical protein